MIATKQWVTVLFGYMGSPCR